MSGRSRRGNKDPQGGGDGGGDPAVPPAVAAPAEDAPDYPQLILAALQATNTVLAGLGTALQNPPADMAAAIPAPPPPPPVAVAEAAPPPPAAVRSPFRTNGASALDFHTKEGKKCF